MWGRRTPTCLLLYVCLTLVPSIQGFAVRWENGQARRDSDLARNYKDWKKDCGNDFEPSVLGNYSKAGVAVDGKPCAQVALSILEMDGTAVDAAIAGMFCNGVYMSHSLGIGGGFIMTIYSKKDKKVETLFARETAPQNSSKDMYHGDSLASLFGGLSIGVPGQVKGFWEAKMKYGNPAVSWKSLIQPTIDMCRNGVTVSRDVASALRETKFLVMKDPGLRETFIDESTGDFYKAGDTFKWPKLAETLERIAENGWKEFYLGETADRLIEDLEKAGSIINKEDLMKYEVLWEPPLQYDLGSGLTMYSPLPPASGPILAFIMNVLKNYDWSNMDLDDPLTNHRIVEAFKFAYAKRTLLGDPFDKNITSQVEQLVKNLTDNEYGKGIWQTIEDDKTYSDYHHYGADFDERMDSGTSHLSIISPNGDAVAITSTINQYFGSVIMSPQTGIILNDEMNDFSAPNITSGFGLPPSPANFIIPGKMPLSSTVPTIVIDETSGDARLVIGAAGGTKITSAVARAMIDSLWKDANIKQAIDRPRIHHQLMPMRIFHEKDVPKDVLKGLQKRGHRLECVSYAGVICGVSKEKDGRIYANADFRKEGGVAGI